MILNNRNEDVNTIHTRLAYLIDKLYDGNLSEMSRATGVIEPTLRNYVNGRVPKADQLVKIIEALKIDGHWLLTGHDLGTGKGREVTSNLLLDDLIQTSNKVAQLAEQIKKDSK